MLRIRNNLTVPMINIAYYCRRWCKNEEVTLMYELNCFVIWKQWWIYSFYGLEWAIINTTSGCCLLSTRWSHGTEYSSVNGAELLRDDFVFGSNDEANNHLLNCESNHCTLNMFPFLMAAICIKVIVPAKAFCESFCSHWHLCDYESHHQHYYNHKSLL